MEITIIVEIISAVGALGTAATGLVDTTKLFGGGVSNTGYASIKQQLKPFEPLLSTIPEGAAYATIYGLWINGTAIEDQKAKAKALIKLGFAPATVDAMKAATGLPVVELALLAENIANGVDLSPPQVNIYGRLDAILSAVIDAAYEKANQRYRNAAKALAAAIGIVLALIGGYAVTPPGTPVNWLFYAVMGAIATPLAPVVKDLTTAINTAVQSSGQLRALLK
ncbi:MAG: hypothetical protein ACLPG5_07735 [Acidocella sp.]